MLSCVVCVVFISLPVAVLWTPYGELKFQLQIPDSTAIGRPVESIEYLSDDIIGLTPCSLKFLRVLILRFIAGEPAKLGP